MRRCASAVVDQRWAGALVTLNSKIMDGSPRAVSPGAQTGSPQHPL
jgi:hypothetical protein